MARILVVGNAQNPLERERSLVGKAYGHDIFFFSSLPSDWPELPVYCLPDWASKYQILRILFTPLALKQAIRTIKPDLIHVHYGFQGLANLVLVGQHPLLLSIMGGDILPDQEYRGIYKFLIRWLLNHADRITSKSDYLDLALNNINDYRDKTIRVTWGVDLHKFHPDRDVSWLRKNLALTSDVQVIFDPRKARPIYNKDIILEAFAKYLVRTSRPAVLLSSGLFGSTSYTDQLKKKARDLGIIDQVRFIEKIDPSEIPDYYVLADITISVPSSDGLAHTVYEAMACESFLIISDLPAYKGIVEDGVTARLVPVRDIDSLADAICWVEEKQDICAQAKKFGRSYVEENANLEDQSYRVSQIYSSMLASFSTKT